MDRWIPSTASSPREASIHASITPARRRRSRCPPACRLDTALRNLGVGTLVCAGLWANVCMGATALDALYRNYRVIWLRDGTLAGEKPEGVATLANTARWVAWFEEIVGYTVTSAEFAAACAAGR